jgi:hypothetical protein
VINARNEGVSGSSPGVGLALRADLRNDGGPDGLVFAVDRRRYMAVNLPGADIDGFVESRQAVETSGRATRSTRSESAGSNSTRRTSSRHLSFRTQNGANPSRRKKRINFAFSTCA